MATPDLQISDPVVVLDPADLDHHTVRIPAIIHHGGRLLVFAEGRRHQSGDTGEIDLLVRHSDDAGQTWSPVRIVASVPGATCGNPVPISDPRSGDLVLLSCRNAADATEAEINASDLGDRGRRVFVQRSSDGGLTFDTAREITAQVRHPGWGWYATGPGHGIALQHGPHAGRLVVGANHAPLPDPTAATDGEALSGGHCLLSDDGGHQWRMGYLDDSDDGAINVNETSLAELHDGSIHVNARNHHGTATPRVAAWSSDGAASIDGFVAIPRVTAPGIQGAVLTLPDGALLLVSAGHPSERRELTGWRSDDGGHDWSRWFTLPDERVGYCDLALLDHHRVALVHEAGEATSHDQLRLRILTLEPSR